MSHDDPQHVPDIRQRKVDHLDLCAREDVEYRLKTTLLDEVHLLHQSLPELSLDELDLSSSLAGKPLRVPLCVTGMTGGAAEARDVNRRLAALAQQHGMAFGVGSQRPMLLNPALLDTFSVRDLAPDIVLLANLGAVQAAATPTRQIQALVDDIGADALCVHLNPAQELIQAGGDRDFRGCLAAIERLVHELSVPVIAKETGCGMSPQTAAKLHRVGVRWVDVSGAGGTTWVGVEALRASPGRRPIGEDLWEWGIPTAASVLYAQRAGLEVIASGGLRDGLDLAKALALGAKVGGMALPFLRALRHEGDEGAQRFAQRVIETLKAVMLLSDARDLAALRAAPKLLGPQLRMWRDG